MDNKGFLSTLGKRWATFLGVVLEPGAFLLLVVLGLLYWYSGTDGGDTTSVLMYILLTIASVVLGGRLTKKWLELTEGDVVTARGHSAVRSLMTQLRSIAALENTTRQFRSAEAEIEKNPDAVKRNYDEVIRTCESLQEQTVSAIENWTDIVPEASIKSQVGVISDLKMAIDQREGDLNSLKAELQDAKGKSRKEKAKLEDRIAKEKEQVEALQNELYKKKYEISPLLPTDSLTWRVTQNQMTPLVLAAAADHHRTKIRESKTIGELLVDIPDEDDEK